MSVSEGRKYVKVVLLLLNLLDLGAALTILAGGVVVLCNYRVQDTFLEFVFYCGPFFGTGGLMLFMVLCNTCGIQCPREAHRVAPNCCSIFSDFLAFIVLAAEVALAILILVTEDLITRSIKSWLHHCDRNHPRDLGDCPDEGSAGGLVDEFHRWDDAIAAILLVLAFLQVLRLVFGVVYRNDRLRNRGLHDGAAWDKHFEAESSGSHYEQAPSGGAPPSWKISNNRV